MVDAVTVISGLSKLLALFRATMGLLKDFEPKKQVIFTEYVEPAFLGLKPIMRTYIDDIGSYRRDVSQASKIKDIRAALDKLEQRRRGTITQRSELLGELDALAAPILQLRLGKDTKDTHAFSSFLEAIGAFFKQYHGLEIVEDDFGEPFGTSALTSLIIEANRALLGQSDGANLDEHIKNRLVRSGDITLWELERKVREVNQHYTALRFECVGTRRKPSGKQRLHDRVDTPPRKRASSSRRRTSTAS